METGDLPIFKDIFPVEPKGAHKTSTKPQYQIYNIFILLMTKLPTGKICLYKPTKEIEVKTIFLLVTEKLVNNK